MCSSDGLRTMRVDLVEQTVWSYLLFELDRHKSSQPAIGWLMIAQVS